MMQRIFTWVVAILAIPILASALIHYVVYRPTEAQVDAQVHAAAKLRSANNAKFRELRDAGVKQQKNEQYGEALGSFQEAERSGGPLDATQYGSLKDLRAAIAQACETAGRSEEAQSAYKALVDSGMQGGTLLMQTQQRAEALARYQDAEAFAGHLTDGKLTALQQARSLEVGSLRELKRYKEAEETTQRMIDDLQSSANDFDPALQAEYLELAMTYSQEQDWSDEEHALIAAIAVCEKSIGYYSDLQGGEEKVQRSLLNKDYAWYWLVNAYQSDGKTDIALSSADEFYKFAGEHLGPAGELQPYPRREIVALAMRIASATNQRDAMELWQRRASARR
jgi:hypothetical protein